MRSHRNLLLIAFAILALTLSFCLVASAQTSATGSVAIDFTFTRIPGTASNQYAIWIENPAGQLVKTLYLTNYMGPRQGWKARPQSLVTWGKAAGVPGLPQADIDAVSGPTPQTGKQSVTWNLTDKAGKPVAPGTYTYKLEASLLWANTELYSGTIAVGSSAATSKPTVTYFPAGADTLKRSLISEVSARFTPGK